MDDTTQADTLRDHPRGLVRAAVVRFIVVALFFDALGPLFPYIADNYGFSERQFQRLLGTCYVIFALSQLASVSVISILGLYGTAAASCLLVGIAALLACLTDHAVLFSLMFIALFAFNSVGSNATRLALREASSDQGFRRLFAWTSGAAEIKQIAAPFIVAALTAAYGWRWAMAAMVLPVIIVGVWIALAQGNWRAPLVYHGSAFCGWRKVASAPSFYVPTLLAASFQLAFAPISARLPFLLTKEAGLDALSMGMLLSVASAAVAASLFLSGWFAPRCTSRNLVKVGVVIIFIGLASLLGSHFLGVAYAAAGMIMVQAALGFVTAPCAADVLHTSAENRAKASGLFGFVQPIAGGLGVALANVVHASTLNISIGMTLTSLALMIGLLASFSVSSHGR